MKKIKKSVSIILIILMFVGRFGAFSVLATETEETVPEETTQEQTQPEETATEATPEEQVGLEVPEETPSPTPEPDVGLESEADVTNDIDSGAISGENSITEPTPTPTPEIKEETGSQEETEELSCLSEVDELCDVQPEATDSGEVVIEGESEEVKDSEGSGSENETGDDSSVIDTGDAVSVVQAENKVNTTEIDSQVLFQTLNIVVPGDIDLTISPLIIADEIFNKGNNQDPVVSVTIVDATNYAFVSNDIVSGADTGGNSIEGADGAVINSGDAYSIISLLNEVNTTIVGSTIHLVTINIFGNIDGNILLPEISLDLEECCSEGILVDNDATVENDVDSLAVSGQNSIITDGEGEASITTGAALSTVNVVNIVNTSLIDTVFHYLFINNLGVWIGDFLGWDNFDAASGGTSMLLSSILPGGGEGSCLGCVGDTSIQNEARVVNNVSSTANTGSNTIEGSGGYINTGSAFSSISIFNFINASIINSIGFLGSINIFGALNGDIGGASLFAEEEKGGLVEEVSAEGGESGPQVREKGGELEIYQYNNVASHVLPGDTVTFFISINNPGTGMVYDSTLWLGLFNEQGEKVGGGAMKLGDIKHGEGIKLVTGLELSKDAKPGKYMAHAEVFGFVGPDDQEISAYSDSFFLIAGFSIPPIVPGVVDEVQAVEPKEVLGAVSSSSGLNREDMYKFLFLGLLSMYIPTKGYRKRKEIGTAIVKGGKYASEKSVALKSFFASFLA